MPPPDLEALLVHEPLVRGLARSLLRGDARVDDVVQETWVAALKGGPRQPASLRAWLAAVARNVAYSVRRRDAARRRIEHGAARREPLPSVAEIAAKEDIRKRVLDALLDLDEPYRTALLLRYYEDLPPREIAKRLEIPVETARTRVKRGLQQLRGRLDTDHGGDRRAWAVALVPLAFKREAVPAGAVGTLLLRLLSPPFLTRALLVAGIVAAVVVTVSFVSPTEEPERQRAPSGRAAGAAAGLTGAEAANDDAPPPDPESVVVIAGRVIDPGHRPVPGARVAALARPTDFYTGWNEATRVLEGFDPPARRLAGTVSDGNGAFELSVPRDSRLALRARTDELASAGLVALDTHRDIAGVVVQLHLLGELSGQVIDARNRPIADVRVWARAQGNAWERQLPYETRTDSEGRFALRVVPDRFRILFHHPNYAPRHYREIFAPDRHVRVRLEKGHTVTGAVLTRDTRGPVADATVTVAPADFSYAPVTGRTGPEGKFRIAHVGGDGPLRFNLIADSVAGYRVLSEVVGTDGVEALVGPTRTLRGRAVTHDADGNPVPAAGVQLTLNIWVKWYAGIYYGNSKPYRRIRTDRHGRFEVAGLWKEGGTVYVTDPRYALAPGATTDRRNGTGFDGNTADIEIPIVERGEIEGRVIDGRGAPVAGAQVCAGHADYVSLDWAAGIVYTDAAGAFRLRGVTPHPKLTVWAFRADLGLGKAPATEPVVRLEGGGLLRGRVQDEGGAPLARVRVTVAYARPPATTYTDDDGAFRLAAVGRMLFFERRGFEAASVAVDGAGELAPVVLKRGHRLTGRVVDDDDRPVANAWVRFWRKDRAAGRSNWATATDANGHFVLEDVPAVEGGISTWARDLLHGEARTLTPPVHEEVTLRMTAAHAIAGLVLDRDGRPLAGARVTAIRTDRRGGRGGQAEAWCDRKGRFDIRGLAEGVFRLKTTARNEVFDNVLDVRADTTEVVVRAETPVTLAGFVIRPTALKGRQMRVYAYREDRDLERASRRGWNDDQPRTTMAGADGRFEMKGLIGKSFTVWVEHREYACEPQRGVAAESRGIRVKLEKGESVKGVAPGAQTVTLEAADGRGASRSATVDARGRFEVEGLAPGGTYHLIARSADGKLRAESEHVTAGENDLKVELKPQ
ncbi:MAG: sigma-70 family RNA polymerase sigma factor [Planctomycetota bacterium]|jgi:RNA polymerase sigma-70 factor (ECF subfamily)